MELFDQSCLPAPWNHLVPLNLGDLFFRSAEHYGEMPLLQYKSCGLYRNLSWNRARAIVTGACRGLMELGVRQDDRVGILSENRYEWLLSDLAILAAGAIDVPMHAPLTSSQAAYQLRDSGARWCIVSTDDQMAKIAASLEGLPDLQGIICFDSDPMERCRATRLECISWQGLVQRGMALHDQESVFERVSQRRAEDLATMIYTSGTTGEPKGVMLSHGNLYSNAAATAQSLMLGSNAILLSWLPYSHIYARLCDWYFSILCGTSIALADNIDTVTRNLLEVQPTHITGVPRLYEKIWEAMESFDRKTRNARLRHLFGPRAVWLSAGGAALPVHVTEGFQDAGLVLLEGYGLTESSPVIASNTIRHNKVGTVGKPIPGVEVAIAEDGEVLSRGPHIMRGYWNKDAATAAAIDEQGWLHTGDLGELDAEGFLRITGRKKDLIVTSAGKNIAPQLIEGLLLADSLIDQAVVYGDGKKFLSALIVPHYANVRDAIQSAVPLSDSDLVAHPDVVALIEHHVAAALEDVSPSEKVKRFVLLDRSFTLADEELTATMKVRRHNVILKYMDRLDQLYDDPEE